MAITGLALGFTGCTDVQPVNPARPQTASGSTVPSPTDTVLTDAARALVTRSGPYLAQRRQLFNAELELTRRCMLSQGLTYPATPQEPTVDDDEWTPNLEARRRHGYGLDPSSQPSPEQWLRDLPAAERAKHVRALKGDPNRRATYELPSGTSFNFATTGCIAQSRIQLYGNVVDAARVSYLPQEVQKTIYHRIAGDQEMQKAITQWSACMRGRGHAISSLQDARNFAIETYKAAQKAGRDPTAARTTELQIATADAECAVTSRLSQVAERVGWHYANELSPDQRRELNSVAAVRTSALQRASG